MPSSQSPSSSGSILSSPRDQSIEYDTPGTSTVVTPAELSIEVRKTLLNSKRKRYSTDDFAADARLAEALQAEEYEEIENKPNKRSRLSVVNDSDDDESLLSDLSEEDHAVGFRGRISKPAGRASLPSRSARDSAKKNITSLRIDDSEEGSVSEFSELNSDDLDDESESESDSEDVLTIAAAVATLDSAVPNTEQATSSAPARRRRRRVAPGNAAARVDRQGSWRRRRIAGLNYRVSHEL